MPLIPARGGRFEHRLARARDGQAQTIEHGLLRDPKSAVCEFRDDARELFVGLVLWQLQLDLRVTSLWTCVQVYHRPHQVAR